MKETQCDKVLRHMRDYGSISSIEAITEYGILRLASRISDLKKRGHVISSTICKCKNRYGETTHYSVYKLIELKQNEREPKEADKEDEICHLTR